MTSTSVTKIGGVVVVTQVIPQDEGSIPLQSAAPATWAPPRATQAPPSVPTKMNDMTAAFLRGEPQGLGVRCSVALFSVVRFGEEVLWTGACRCSINDRIQQQNF